MLLINDKTYFCKLLTKSTDYIRCKEKSFFNYFFLYWAKVRIAKFLIKLSLWHIWVFYQPYQNVYHLFWSLKKTCENRILNFKYLIQSEHIFIIQRKYWNFIGIHVFVILLKKYLMFRFWGIMLGKRMEEVIGLYNIPQHITRNVCVTFFSNLYIFSPYNMICLNNFSNSMLFHRDLQSLSIITLYYGNFFHVSYVTVRKIIKLTKANII